VNDAGPLLDVRDIHTAYGLSRVLFGVSVEVQAGECVCLLGRNGVGKTTTIRSIMGLTPPQAGRIVWKGADITGWPSAASCSRSDGGRSAPARQAAQRGAGEARQDPLLPELRAELLVEADRGRVPVEDRPLHPAAAPAHRDRRQLP